MRVLALVLVAACTPAASLLATEIEPPGENCAAGGQVVRGGLDDDGDGVLDGNEVDSEVFICATGPRALVSVRPESSGDRCALGGQAIDIGFDLDGDGQLDVSEVISTSYVCSGFQPFIRVRLLPAGTECEYGGQVIESGADLDGNGMLDDLEVIWSTPICVSSDGLQPLVKVTHVSPGGACGFGIGSTISVGLDIDRDGSLSDLEIQSSTTLCNQVLAPSEIIGDVIVRNSFDVAQLDGVVSIMGTLTLAGSTVPYVPRFSTLQHVDAISFEICPADPISFPELVTVNFAYLCGSSIQLPRLVSGTVRWDGVDDDVVLPSLTYGRLDLGGSATSVSAPLFEVGSLSVWSTSLSSISLPVMSNGFITLASPVLASTVLPALQYGGVSISQSTLLSSLSIPLWEGGQSLGLSQLPRLTTLDVPLLTTLESLYIANAPAFPTCRAQQLAAQTNPMNVTVMGTDDAAVCP